MISVLSFGGVAFFVLRLAPRPFEHRHLLQDGSCCGLKGKHSECGLPVNTLRSGALGCGSSIDISRGRVFGARQADFSNGTVRLGQCVR